MGDPLNKTVLDYLKAHGEQLDSEIATGTGMTLNAVRTTVAALSARGDVVMCRVTRYRDGRPVEGTLYRASGFTPKPAAGRKRAAATAPTT